MCITFSRGDNFRYQINNIRYKTPKKNTLKEIIYIQKNSNTFDNINLLQT